MTKTTTPIFTNFIEYKEIKTWSENENSETPTPTAPLINNDIVPLYNYHKEAKFKIDNKINSRISIWFGELYSVNTDVIVYSNTSMLTERDGVADKIFKYGGRDMISDIEKNGECRYGESVITSGGNLPSRYVVHTICPTFNSKYLSAAENALNSCYRSAFHLSMDNKVKSISFSCLHTKKRNYPPVNGCHIALRTIRRFLEKSYSSSFERVILVMDSIENMELYEQILPLYFPRNNDELLFSQNSLPIDIGDENGESIVEDRKIRIIETPKTIIREPEDEDCFYYDDDDDNNTTNTSTTTKEIPIVNNNNNSSKLGSDKNKEFLKSIEPDRTNNDNFNYKYDSIDRILNPFSPIGGSGGITGTSPGCIMDGNSFTLKKEDPDIVKRRQFSKKTDKQIQNEKLQHQFQILLTRSKVEDLSEVSRLNFTIQTTDDQNKPFIVIIGSQLNSRKDLFDKVLLYLIRVLEQTIQRGNFSIIYFHSNMSSQNSPDLSWLKKLLEIFELKYKDHLNEFNIIHPTFLLKTTIFLSKSILGDKGVLSKIVYHENMTKISKYISKCNIPKSVFSYEFSKNEIDNFSFSFDNDVTL